MARTFDSTTDRISFGTTALPAIGSMAFWFKPTWAQTDGVSHYLFQTNQAGGNVCEVQHEATNSYRFGWVTGFVDYRGTVVDASYTQVEDAWNHFAMTWDDTANETRFYLNGVEIGTQVASLVTHTTTSAKTIGNPPAGVANVNASGDFAEFAVWEAVLTATEVTSLSKAAAPSLIRPSALVDYLPLVREMTNYYGTIGTDANTAAAVHPRMIYPAGSRQVPPRNVTRFYLPSTGAADVSPTYAAGWEETVSGDRLKMVTTKIASAMADKTATTLITAGDTLVRQYVSSPLSGAQTVNTTAKLYARANEALLTVDAISRIILTVVSNDGTTVRGTLLALADYSTGAEFNQTTNRNKSFANGDALTSVNASDGDRIVLEIGFNHGAAISSATINFGDDSATDLTEDETTTTANNPWLEIEQTLLISAVSVVNFTGTVTAVSTMTATLTTPALMSGTVTAVQTTTATLTTPALMSGTVTAVSTMTADLIAPSLISGFTAAGVGTMTGSLSSTPLLSGTVTAVGTLSAELSSIPLLTGTVAGVSTFTATLTTPALIVGAVAGVSTMTAEVSSVPLLVGTITAVSTFQATLSSPANLGSATFAGVFTMTVSAVGSGSRIITGLHTTQPTLGVVTTQPSLMIVTTQPDLTTTTTQPELGIVTTQQDLGVRYG